MKKKALNKKDYANEVGMVAAIIGDHIAKKLYGKMDETYLVTVALIAQWSVEFVDKHKNTDWEEMQFDENLVKPLSKWWKSKSKHLMCWDDAVIDFAFHKLETYGK